MENYQYIIVAGNLSDGFTFLGPFLTFDAAAIAAEGMPEMTWIATLDEYRPR